VTVTVLLIFTLACLIIDIVLTASANRTMRKALDAIQAQTRFIQKQQGYTMAAVKGAARDPDAQG
jgi:hypothetical protein